MSDNGACWRYRYWKGKLEVFRGECPIHKEDTDGDETCGYFESNAVADGLKFDDNGDLVKK